MQEVKTRRKQEKSELKKMLILEASSKAFASYDYQSVTIRKIGEEAEIKHQLIAYYFKNKEELWRAVVEHLYQGFMSIGRFQVNSKSTSVEEQFKAHIRHMVTYIYENPELFKIVTKELFQPSPRLATIKRHMALFAKMSFGSFDELRKRGYFKNIANQELYFILSGAMTQRILFPEMHKLVTNTEMTKNHLTKHIDAIMEMVGL